jgi:ABC-type transport system substrate-binding protein/ABC-type branched-subunit amino acid transport system substrate-binding protein
VKGKLGTVLAIVAIFSLGLAACGPTPVAAPTEAPPPPPPAETPTAPPAPAAAVEDEWGVVKVAKGDPIKVGFAAGLSGAGIDVLGLDEQRGAELAVKDKPEILGFPVELQVEDEQCSAEGGQTVATKLVADPQIVALVGHMCSSSCTPASKVYEQNGYTMISPSCTAPSLTNPDLDGTTAFFRTCWNDKIQGPAAAKFVYETLGVKKVATIHDGSPYAEQLGQEFSKAFEALGGEIVAAEAVNVGDTDMRPVLTRIKAAGPELIYFSAFVAEGGYLRSQMADVGMEGVMFMGADGIKADEFIKAAGDAAEGVYASAGNPAEAGPDLPKFLEAYEATYGEKPIAPFHAQAYDAYMVIANAIEKVGQVDADGNLLIGRKALNDAIRGTKDYQGLSGKISCDENGDCGAGSVAVSMVQGGQWVAAEVAAAPPAEEAKCVLKAVEKVDDYTVKFTFYRPHAPFLAQLASAMMPMVSPAAVQKNMENSFKTPVGTGPMKFVEWIPEDTITIVRNDDYWGEKAKLDKMVFRVIKDDPARLLELQTGTIDGADSIRPDDIPVVEADPNLALFVRPAFTIGYLGMNTDREPFNKLEVRQAVNYALDKQAIVDAIAPRTAVTAKEYLPPLMWGYNDEVVDYEYNPEKAKELLAQAGYPEGFELYLWYLPVRRSYFPEAILIAEIMQDQLQAVGITCHLVTYDWGTYLSKIRNDEADLWMAGWMSDFGDPDNNLYTFFGGTTNSWAKGPPDQELFDLLIQAKSEPDVAKRTELYKQANQRTHDIALGVPVMHNAGAFAAKKEVKGIVPDPFYLEYWYNIETPTGTFIWGRAGDAVGLDAWDETDGESFMVTLQIFEGLYARVPGKSDVEPSLADGMPEVSADGTVWTIKLKQGIKFHDGTDFNADAVVFNIERAWDPNHPFRNTTHTNEYVYFSDFFGAFKGE